MERFTDSMTIAFKKTPTCDSPKKIKFRYKRPKFDTFLSHQAYHDYCNRYNISFCKTHRNMCGEFKQKEITGFLSASHFMRNMKISSRIFLLN